MAQVLNFQTGEVEDMPDGSVTAAVAAGSHGLPLGDVAVISPDGRPGVVPAEKASEAFQAGYRLETQKEVLLREQGDTTGEVKAFAEGAGRGLTFGLSDLALTKTGLVEPKLMEARREANPVAAIGGEVAGTAASLLIPGGGALGAAGKLGRVAEGAVARVAGEGLAGRLVAKATGGALEGSLFGMGSAVSESALGDTDLTAEKLLAGAGVGAVVGGGLGALGGLAAEGLGAAKGKLNALAKEKVAQAEAKAASMGAESAAEETASLRGKYGGEAQKSSRLLNNAKELAGDAAVSEEKRVALGEALTSDSAKELRDVTARNVLEDFEGQAGATLRAKDAFHAASESEADRAASKAASLLDPAEAIAQVKARAARYGAPAIGRLVGGTVGTLAGGLPGAAAGALAGDLVGSLAGGQLRPSLNAVKRMFEHPSVVKAFYGAVEKATQATPEVFGRFSGVLSRAAAAGASDLAVTHLALMQREPDYAQQMAQAGFPLEGPGDTTTALHRAGQLSAVEKAVAAHDKRMDAVIDGLLKGERPTGVGGARLASESRKDFGTRAAEMARLATDPQALADAFRLSPALSVAAPGLSASLAATATRAVGFLHEKAPKNPNPPNMPALTKPWTPSDAQLSTWEKYMRAVERPATVLEDLQKGTATKEGVEALQAVYPKLAEDVKQRVLERMANLEKRLPFQQRRTLATLFGPDFSGPTPQAQAVIQRAHAEALAKEMAKGRAPMPSAKSRDAMSLATQSQRLEGR